MLNPVVVDKISSWWDDAKDAAQLKLFELGITSTPPIVMPVDASPELIEKVEKLEKEYSRTANISKGVKETFVDTTESIGSIPAYFKGISSNIVFIVIGVLLIYFIFRKEVIKI